MSFIIDTAINGQGLYAGKAYFFKDNQYVRYDWNSEQVDTGYPLNMTEWNVPEAFQYGLDAALNGAGQYAGKAYFFRHGIFFRYDWLTQSCDSDYPAHIDLWKLPETFLYPSGKIRDHIWYVTIDDYDYFQFNNLGHANNLRGLQDIAEKVGVQADPIWMANLSD